MVGGPCRVEHGPAVVRGEPADARAGRRGAVGAESVAGAPRQGERGLPGRAAVLGQGVEEGGGRAVFGLPGRAEQSGRRGEEHEGGGVVVGGQLVQVEGGRRGGGQEPGGPRVLAAPGVEHGGEGPFAACQYVRERGAVGEVAGLQGDPGSRRGSAGL